MTDYSNKRHIVVDLDKVIIDELEDWLVANEYKYAFLPNNSGTNNFTVANIDSWKMLITVEVYSEEAETALRIAWETE